MIIGVDVGGTKIAAAGVRRGRVATPVVLPTPWDAAPQQVFLQIAEAIRQAAGRETISSIGLGVAGIIDWRSGVIIQSSAFGSLVNRFPLGAKLSKLFNCPVTVENDANVFALGEALHGAARQFRNVVGVTVGTGIGAGIIFDREIYHGKNNLAGEVGFMIQDQGKIFQDLANGEARRRNGKTEEVRRLGDGLFSLLTTLDPDCIVVGGGVAKEPGIVQKARQIAYSHVYYPGLRRTPILESELFEQAAILGAAELARRLL